MNLEHAQAASSFEFMRLLVHVEGQTEEMFVNSVLGPHLHLFGYTRVSARLIGNARQRARRGGARAWAGVREEIVRHLRNDSKACSTTMVDYYALPNDWPGRAASSACGNVLERSRVVERAIADDLRAAMGAGFEERRFIPFVVLHEFEALLFSDCAAFARAIGEAGVESAMQTIRNAFDTPEHINDSPHTAPSKRILSIVPGYTKVLSGSIASQEVGIARMEQSCPNFGAWLLKLRRAVDAAA